MSGVSDWIADKVKAEVVYVNYNMLFSVLNLLFSYTWLNM